MGPGVDQSIPQTDAKDTEAEDAADRLLLSEKSGPGIVTPWMVGRPEFSDDG
jgi:hypothetical protein